MGGRVSDARRGLLGRLGGVGEQRARGERVAAAGRQAAPAPDAQVVHAGSAPGAQSLDAPSCYDLPETCPHPGPHRLLSPAEVAERAGDLDAERIRRAQVMHGATCGTVSTPGDIPGSNAQPMHAPSWPARMLDRDPVTVWAASTRQVRALAGARAAARIGPVLGLDQGPTPPAGWWAPLGTPAPSSLPPCGPWRSIDARGTVRALRELEAGSVAHEFPVALVLDLDDEHAAGGLQLAGRPLARRWPPVDAVPRLRDDVIRAQLAAAYGRELDQLRAEYLRRVAADQAAGPIAPTNRRRDPAPASTDRRPEAADTSEPSESGPVCVHPHAFTGLPCAWCPPGTPGAQASTLAGRAWWPTVLPSRDVPPGTAYLVAADGAGRLHVDTAGPWPADASELHPAGEPLPDPTTDPAGWAAAVYDVPHHLVADPLDDIDDLADAAATGSRPRCPAPSCTCGPAPCRADAWNAIRDRQRPAQRPQELPGDTGTPGKGPETGSGDDAATPTRSGLHPLDVDNARALAGAHVDRAGRIHVRAGSLYLAPLGTSPTYLADGDDLTPCPMGPYEDDEDQAAAYEPPGQWQDVGYLTDDWQPAPAAQLPAETVTSGRLTTSLAFRLDSVHPRALRLFWGGSSPQELHARDVRKRAGRALRQARRIAAHRRRHGRAPWLLPRPWWPR